jgi:PAS domain S-box-containing protein
MRLAPQRKEGGMMTDQMTSDFFAHAFSQSNAAFLFIDDHQTIRFFNTAAEKIFGFPSEEIIGKPLSILFSKTVLLQSTAIMERYLESTCHPDFANGHDFLLQKKTGCAFWGNFLLSELIVGTEKYYSVLSRDISEQKRLSEDLKFKNEQLLKLNHQMERFLYSTSHDLRSPLTSILGLVHLLRMETSDKTILEFVSRIESSTLKLDNIIRDIVCFSKTTYQKRKSEKLDLEAMVWRIINTYRDIPDFKRIFFNVSAKQDGLFFADSERVEIILTSIISNAIQFFDSNKMRPFIRVNVEVDLQGAHIEVIDNGIGIAQQHQAHIFDMFYKGTVSSNGAGLGLYIVKEGLEQLGGDISLESEVGFGSVFRISLPNDRKGKLISRKLKLIRSSQKGSVS